MVCVRQPLFNFPLSVLHSELVSEQKADSTLEELFQSVPLTDEAENPAQNILIVCVTHCGIFP